MKDTGSYLLRVLKWLLLGNCAVAVGILLFMLSRVFIMDSFIIPSESMCPTLNIGDRIRVNKLLYGARLYTSFDFQDHNELKSIRMPGIRKIRYADIICFNYPHGYDNNCKIEFKINYVYCKRVLGTPGDRIGVVDGHYWNDRILRPLGVIEEQDRLRWMYDSVFIWSDCYSVIPKIPTPDGSEWNIKNWGPIIVPAKGLTVSLDEFTTELYRQVIEYETGCELSPQTNSYTFKKDYYFAVGDNCMDSSDSRYWGFIPNEFIIGIVAGNR